MARGWALSVLACLAAVTVLAACSDKHEADTSSRTTTSAKSSPTFPPLGPADFPVPAEARQKSEAGALAFVRYYIDLTNHQAPSLDSSPLRTLSKDCEECNQLADSYDADRAAQRTYEGGNLSLSSTSNVVIQGDTAEIGFSLHQEKFTVRDRAGTVVDSSPAYTLSGGMGLAWDGSRSTWLVTQFPAERI